MQKYLRGQIWWCKNTYDATTGERELPEDRQQQFNHIQEGIRPVLIVSDDTNNKYASTLLVAPCTSRDKKTLPSHYEFFLGKTKNTLLCEQLKTVNKIDLTHYMITLDKVEMEEVDKRLRIATGLEHVVERVKIEIPKE